MSMGTCKDSLKTTPAVDKTKDSGSKSVFGGLLPRKKTAISTDSVVQTFADNIAEADKKLSDMVIQKTSDLSHEKGVELSNTLKLGNLKNMQMHLDAIIDLMNDYAEIK